MGKDLKSISEVAEMYGVTVATVRLWCVRGLLPNAVLIGTGKVRGTWVIPARDLEGFTRPKKTGRPKRGAKLNQ
jgi:hypothetical protein